MRRRRTVWWAAGFALLAIAVSGGAVRNFWTRQRELDRLSLRLTDARRRVAELEARRDRAENDAAFIEMAARREFGFVAPDEIEFRFVSDDGAAPAPKEN
ncbi:MAG: septum formation initiator family protein [Elusimicrobia bacterium]|nr:septum formation initiator family protein [Elusimicrobiota bacterium]MBK7208647.1 septum formation initiator family protein [Elusimicrobiota bacterium]MBK7545390.1 septum formation initiator family protein [Elusimicrobiota bacterium]MBK7575593.1 septum formation initiator family protein [Elusimicrobiota bacterium]MBK7688503.1 septum formation initiator family protein [Elusimicrobiota bacterium]